MDEQNSLNGIESLLIQLALHTRELYQKKNEIQQQIKACSADVAERKSHIETIQGDIEKLEEETSGKQSTVLKNKEHAKSMKATNSLLLQYEQTLRAELESRKTSYNHDLEVYEERISSYRETFQSYKESYLQNPAAQELLVMQAENEEINCRIKACDDQIMTNRKELQSLEAVSCVSSESLPDSVLSQQPITEQDEQSEPKEDSGSSIIDVSSLRLYHTTNEHETFVEASVEETHEVNEVQDPPACFTSPGKANEELWSCQQVEEQSQPDEMHAEPHDEETPKDDEILEQQLTGLGVEDVKLDEMQDGPPTDEEKPPADEEQQEVAVFTPTSSREPFSDKTFAFNFSPTGSPRQCTSDTKSPAFLFSINSSASTPGFSGFGFDTGSSQEEDSSFAFSSSIFNEKKATEAKPSTCAGFLFDQPEQSEGFQFAFAAKSPESASKENDKDEFPFSFNF